jgi:hypothetical protein
MASRCFSMLTCQRGWARGRIAPYALRTWSRPPPKVGAGVLTGLQPVLRRPTNTGLVSPYRGQTIPDHLPGTCFMISTVQIQYLWRLMDSIEMACNESLCAACVQGNMGEPVRESVMVRRRMHKLWNIFLNLCNCM